MVTSPTTEPPPPPPFSVPVKAALWAQVAIGVLIAGFMLVSANAADEWSDLVRAVGAVLALAYIGGLVIAGLVARFLLRSMLPRVFLIVLLPPLATWLFVLVVRY